MLVGNLEGYTVEEMIDTVDRNGYERISKALTCERSHDDVLN
jgi:hypothetical protein